MKPKCSVEDCKDQAKYAGLCGMHYKRKWRHGDPATTYTPTRGFERTECIAEGCEELADYSSGYCKLHYQRVGRYGRTENINNPKGSGTRNLSGYIVFNINGRRIYEHVLLAEKALGKPLPKGAVVHHTGDPWDNHGFCKLIICPDQAYHMLLHRRMRELGYGQNHSH